LALKEDTSIHTSPFNNNPTPPATFYHTIRWPASQMQPAQEHGSLGFPDAGGLRIPTIGAIRVLMAGRFDSLQEPANRPAADHRGLR